MTQADDYLCCPKWLRWMRCRFSTEFHQTLRDWTEIVAKAVSTDGEQGSLWGDLRPPAVQWLPTNHLNGYARLDFRRKPTILVTIGMHARIHEYCYRLFSTNDLCRQVGAPEREVGSLAELAQSAEWCQSPTVPRCPIREQAVYVTAETALALLFYHEAGHVALGHLENQRGRRAFQERAYRKWWNSSLSKTDAAAHALRNQREEVQADRFAIALACHHLRQCKGVFPGQIVDPVIVPMQPSLLLVAQVVLHVLLCDTSLTVREFDGQDHPHPLTRLLDGVGSLVRARILTGTERLQIAGDAFRMAQAMRDAAITAEEFDAEQRDAHRQLQTIVEHAGA